MSWVTKFLLLEKQDCTEKVDSIQKFSIFKPFLFGVTNLGKKMTRMKIRYLEISKGYPTLSFS